MLAPALSILLAFSAAAFVGKTREPGSLEHWLHAAVLGIGTLLFGLSALGWLSALTGPLVVVYTLFTSGLLFGLASRSLGWRKAARAGAEAFAPVRWLFESVGRRDASALPLAVVLGVCCWTLWLSWLAPSSSYDGVGYHDAMVGVIIQNHGFAIQAMPDIFQWPNGYPHNAELFGVFAGLLDGATWIEAPQSLLAVVAAVAAAGVCLLLSPRRDLAFMAGAVLFTVPAFFHQLRSTYVDVTSAALYLSALYFLLRSSRAEDATAATLALGAYLGTKGGSLPFALLLSPLWLARVWWGARNGERESRVALASSVVLASIMGPPMFVRNLVEHHNPIWPVRYESHLLGITFPGTVDFSGYYERPWGDFFARIVEPFGAGRDTPDSPSHGYGYVVPYLAIVLAPFAAFLLLRAWTSKRDRVAFALGVIVAVGLAHAVILPGTYWARYQLVLIACVIFIAHWVLGHARVSLHTSVIGAALGVQLLLASWATPSWQVPTAQAARLASMTPSERRLVTLTPNVWTREALEIRETFDATTVVAFADRIWCTGNLWNDRFSNRVVYVPSTPIATFDVRAADAGVDYLVLPVGADETDAVLHSERWRRVGTACANATGAYDLFAR